jgi:cyclopropane-fatty-acyl-phospholipid synthase
MTTRSVPGMRSGAVASMSDLLLERIARRVGLAAAAHTRVGCLTVVLPDGSRHVFGDRSSALRAEIRFRDRRALAHMLVHGETGAGEAYMDGGWTSPELPALLELAALNRDALALSAGWWRVPGQLGRTLAHRARRNTRAQARRNIAAHYDLGNDLYRLFLDESLTYSSAVFETPDQSLADAQRNKYRRIAEGAGLRAGMRVLEIGSGWGGFALYAAGELGCRVTTITISKAQADLARERIHAAGLDELVDVQLRDYREVKGVYDAVVSIEMLEAVGAEYYGAFFRACDAALAPGGRLSLQTITFRHDAYEAQRRGANWIQQYIFPGGLVPSLAAIEAATADTRLLLRSARDIADSYVLTLREWRARFLSQLDAVRALGFDDRFIRMWDYYLAISEAGFKTGLSQDHQLVFEKRRALAASAARP